MLNHYRDNFASHDLGEEDSASPRLRVRTLVPRFPLPLRRGWTLSSLRREDLFLAPVAPGVGVCVLLVCFRRRRLQAGEGDFPGVNLRPASCCHAHSSNALENTSKCLFYSLKQITFLRYIQPLTNVKQYKKQYIYYRVY